MRIDEMRKIKTIISICMCGIILIFTSISAQAVEQKPYSGIPKVHLEVSKLDNSGNLIYCGIDFAVFADTDRDGIFTVKDGKVKRILSTSTTFDIDLGASQDYSKGVLHKLAMRTLYVPVGTSVPTGTSQNNIIIADWNNGKEGWVEIPGSLFQPSYFIPGTYVHHTEKWEQNREQYNKSKIKNQRNNEIRAEGIFWSGEKFVVEIETTELVPKLQAIILGTEYKTTLSLTQKTKTGGIYHGEIWDAAMLNQWGNYAPKELTIRLVVLNGNNILEKKEAIVLVDNRDLYYRARMEY